MSSRSPLRPPTGRSRALSGNSRVVRSPPLRSRFVSEKEYDDDNFSVSSSSSSQTRVSLSARTSGRDSPLMETARGARSPSSGILDKLKNDLELIRQGSQIFDEDDSENAYSNRGRFSSGSASKDRHHLTSSYPRSRSVDVPFRDSDAGPRKFDFNPDNKLKKKVCNLEEDNESLQKTISSLKEESAKVREELAEAKRSEADLEKQILKVTSQAEKDRQALADELDEATKRHDSELKSLSEKLCSAEETEKTLQDKIDNLQLAIDGERELEAALKESKADNRKLQETVFLLDNELDGFRDVVNSTKQDNDDINRALVTALEEKSKISTQLRESEIVHKEALREILAMKMLLQESREENCETKRALDDALDDKQRVYAELRDAESALSQTKKAKDLIDELVLEVRKESDVVKRDLDQITQENEVTKKLLSEEKKKSEEARKVYEQKLCDYESQISNLKSESNQVKKDTEEQLAYEKETLNITLRAMEKENAEYAKELQRLSTELEECKSQDVKITSQLKVSAAKHEQTELELKNATDEVENLTAKLCQKNKELEETSNNLTRSINEAEMTKKQLNKAEEELDEKTKILKESMKMTETLNKTIDALNGQISTYKLQIDQCETDLKKAAAACTGSENKSNMLNEEINSLQLELSRLTELYAEMKKENEVMKQGNDSLIIEKENLDLKAKNAERESSSLKEQLNSALQSLDEMMKYIDASREEHDDVIQCLERDLNKALELKQAAENKVTGLADKLKKGEAIMKEKLNKQTGTSLVKISELETSIKEKIAETTLLHDKVKILQGKLDQFNQTIKVNESEMTRQREEHEVKLAEETSVRIKLEENKQSLVEKLSTLEQENTELKESLAEARGRECHDIEHKEQSCKIKELDALVQEKTVEATSLQDKIKTIEAGIEELNQSRKKEAEEREFKLESQLAELKEVLQQTKKTEIQLRGELAHKRQQVAISESNEKHLREHITSLEAQIDKLINDYESKLEDMSES